MGLQLNNSSILSTPRMARGGGCILSNIVSIPLRSHRRPQPPANSPIRHIVGQGRPQQEQSSVAQPQAVPLQQGEHGKGGHRRQPGGQQWLGGGQQGQGHQGQQY